MIKATARSASNRKREIYSLVQQADFNNDGFVQEFGVSVSDKMIQAPGRVLPPPKLQYGGHTDLVWKRESFYMIK